MCIGYLSARYFILVSSFLHEGRKKKKERKSVENNKILENKWTSIDCKFWASDDSDRALRLKRIKKKRNTFLFPPNFEYVNNDFPLSVTPYITHEHKHWISYRKYTKSVCTGDIYDYKLQLHSSFCFNLSNTFISLFKTLWHVAKRENWKRELYFHYYSENNERQRKTNVIRAFTNNSFALDAFIKKLWRVELRISK